ncbi:MAG TPA: DUF3106 domain-containing protein [Acidobacteriaceae bacterium]|nr:DUF3106 domain-containing protein [Acidobacteriaceae bacterium]
MTHERQTRTQGARPGLRIAFAVAAMVSLAMLAGPGARAQHHGSGGERAARPAAAPRQEIKPSPMRPAQPNRNTTGGQGGYGARSGVPVMQPGTNSGFGRRPGQQHLPEWMNEHQNLSPQQQQNLLRREPGFNRLAPDQQQRVLNRLRSLDARPPAVRQRMLERNEMFERLSPEQRQDVRAASQAVRQMPEERQRMLRRAFNDLRQIPPEQRQAILNSARFDHTYTPQERHVLGNLLSIEPYEPR